MKPATVICYRFFIVFILFHSPFIGLHNKDKELLLKFPIFRG